jgi:hypothetical protein
MGRVAPWVGAVVAAGTVGVGLVLDARGTELGVPHPPFVGNWAPRVDAWMLVALPCFAAAVALVPRALRAAPRGFAAALLAGTLVLRLALAAARGGTSAWDHVFQLHGSFEGPNEYLPALRSFAYGSGFFLDRFAELVPSLPVHAAGHPPGLLLTMHALSLDTPARLAAFCIAVGALSAPLTYALGRRVLAEPDARVAGGLMALAPGALLFGVTSADAVYCTLGLLAAIPLVSASRRTQAAGALILGAATLFAWSLLAIAAWAAIVVALRGDGRGTGAPVERRAGLGPAVGLLAIAGAGVIAVQGALAAATGFDPIEALHATSRVYALGIASQRPYWYWLFGSPVAFLLVLGAPTAWLALRNAHSPEARAVWAAIVISAVAGFTKAETERIWLFLAPLVCLAAAPTVRRHRALVAALAAQALIYGALMDTVW